MNQYSFEVRKLTIDDLSLQPACFQNSIDGDAALGKMAHYAQFFVPGIANPVYYFRNVNPDSQRWAGNSEFGGDPLAPQRGLHGDDLAQEKTWTIPYHLVRESPRTYEIASANPFSLLRFTDDGNGGVFAEFKEGKDGCILDLRVEPFPVAVISHANPDQPAPYFQVNTIFSGTYMGHPIKGMGGFDRTFLGNTGQKDKDTAEAMYSQTYQVCCALYSGLRQDGRKECVYALIANENGKGMGMYYIDGEEPVITDSVYLDAVFCRLPYVDDGTIVYTNATWRIGPKTIHFTGQWGTKSFTAYPKLEKHGQSQCFGSWYEGDVPYRHVLEHTFNENSGDAYPERMRKMGFQVVD